MSKGPAPKEVIRKSAEAQQAATVRNYQQSYDNFSWCEAEALMASLPRGHLKIAHETIDRHVTSGHGDQIAIRWIAKSGERTNFTYGKSSRLTNRFASVLRDNGLSKGDRVYALLGRVPELYIAALGTLKAGCVFCPLFSAFGPEPIQARVARGAAKRWSPPPDLISAKWPVFVPHCLRLKQCL